MQKIDTCLYTSNERQSAFACFSENFLRNTLTLSGIGIYLLLDLSIINTTNLKLDLNSKISGA